VGRPVEVVYLGRRVAATVAEDPLFDAAMTRLKL